MPTPSVYFKMVAEREQVQDVLRRAYYPGVADALTLEQAVDQLVELLEVDPPKGYGEDRLADGDSAP